MSEPLHSGRKRGHNKGITKADRERKRLEAEARQVKRAARTTKQQLMMIASRPGASAREVARLKARKS